MSARIEGAKAAVRACLDDILALIMVGSRWAHPERGSWKVIGVTTVGAGHADFPSRIKVSLSGPGPCRSISYVDGMQLTQGRGGWVLEDS